MERISKDEAERRLLRYFNEHLAPGQSPYTMDYIKAQKLTDYGDYWLLNDGGADSMVLVADVGVVAYSGRFKSKEDALAELRALGEKPNPEG